ncbi:putative bifunctional diguanylate cyclase/phosphodiesterase [Aliiroseovarius marinus]|uniref:putative bifunctional diguanylate cyclase/phosphodiesterase n=1 Tax=Aliiroseovarius marinus TaxID=2500159 RepID=UPI003D7CB276
MAAARDKISLQTQMHSVLTSPMLAAFLPAIMVIAYWAAGEVALLAIAILFPGLQTLGANLTRRSGKSSVLDSTTGLPHRNRLLHSLDMGFVDPNAPEKTCIALELDDFQTLVSELGHNARDEILAATADRLRGCLRQSDLVCHLGNARFAISLDKTRRADLEATLQLTARLQDACSEPLSIDSMRILPSCSIGFCLPSRAPEATGEALLTAAETALEAAQASGPNAVRAFTSGMSVRKIAEGQSVQELIRAMDEGQLVPWFQPQIDTDTGRVSGIEALVRWQHPERGLIAPGAFLPLITKANLSERLTEIMLYGSLSALVEWDRAGFVVPGISVNFSADDLNNPKLVEKIRWELDRFNVSPERLTVEILENVVADTEHDITTRNIAALSKLGCQIDLDDFGTGHASISAIQRFDVNRIKIDRSFVTHVDTDRNQQNMVAAILTMAEQLKVETVAEGVETHGEHAMLAQLGCGHVQGFSIAKPMPLDQTSAWIEKYSAQSQFLPAFPRQA